MFFMLVVVVDSYVVVDSHVVVVFSEFLCREVPLVLYS